MLLAVGTKVKFKNSGDVGKVTALLDDGMVQVYIPADDMEIPAFIEDLILADDPRSSTSKFSAVNAKFVKGKQVKKKEVPKRPEIQTQYTILKGKGIQLAFDPQINEEGITESYQMYLINDTRFDVLFTFSIRSNETHSPTTNGKLSAMSFQDMGIFLYDQLNQQSLVCIDCWQVTTQGTGPMIRKDLKIKAKQFFKKQTTAPLLNKRVTLYQLVENFQEKEVSSEEDLKSYTKRKAPQISFRKLHHRHLEKHDIQEMAEFVPELDLHVEKLVGHKNKMNNAEKLRLQLYHFDQFLTKAIRLGISPVFVIHGVGEGKLKNHIASRLIQNPDVLTFKNEYHPKYGFGATEIIL